jgi:hypothetical protein
VFASPTPQTAELVAELFATERDCFHPLSTSVRPALLKASSFLVSWAVVEVGHIQRAIIYILIRLVHSLPEFSATPDAVIASGRSMRVADSVDRIISIISLSL